MKRDWSLLRGVLPLVVAAIAAQAVLDLLGFDGWVDFSEVSVVLTGAIFIIGFMLGGTMADYKESERLPAELACSLEMIEDMIGWSAAAKPEIDRAGALAKLHDLARDIDGWLEGKIQQDQLFESLHQFTSVAREIDRAGGSGASRIFSEIQWLRQMITRIGTIVRTSFLPVGYTLLETLVFANVGLVLISRFKTLFGQYTVLVAVTLICNYLLRLIRDVDQPFDYAPTGARGSSEVDLTPLRAYILRGQSRLASERAATVAEEPVRGAA